MDPCHCGELSDFILEARATHVVRFRVKAATLEEAQAMLKQTDYSEDRAGLIRITSEEETLDSCAHILDEQDIDVFGS